MIVSRVARRSALSAFLIAGSLSVGSLAHADEPAPAPAPAPVAAPPVPPADATWRGRVDHQEETSWYGWQTLLADGTSLLVLPIAAGVSQSSALGVVAVGGYFLAPPFIHGAHGRWGMFAASLGLRVVVPVIGGLLGAAADGDCRGELCIPVGAVIGVVSGVLAAVALDASLLSYETVEPDARYRAQRRKPGAIAWSPSLVPRKEGGLTLGLGASF